MTKKLTLLALTIALALPAMGAAQSGDICLTTDTFANEFELEITAASGDFFDLVGIDAGPNPAAVDGGAVVDGNTLWVQWIKTVLSNGQVAHYACELDIATFSGPGKLTRVREAETLVDDVVCEPCSPFTERDGRPSDTD